LDPCDEVGIIENGFIWLLGDSSEFKAVFNATNSIGINRRGYSGCGGLKKCIEKSETLKSF
jgi:hypothetical protein